jgi:pyridoxal 5'-phosphate synthase pdxT subunit
VVAAPGAGAAAGAGSAAGATAGRTAEAGTGTGAGTATATIGVLDLQGDVREHMAALGDVGVAGRLVKRPDDLAGLSGLILPGGESTTLSMLLTSTGLFGAVSELLDDGLPVLGTCAGLVLLAREVLDGRPDQRSFGMVDAVVRRNGFGRQVASFETELEFGEGPLLPAVFIRAPYVVSVGPEVDVLATVRHRGVAVGGSESGAAGEPGLAGAAGAEGWVGESPALVRQGRVLASCFHPELTQDRRVHRLFAEMCA